MEYADKHNEMISARVCFAGVFGRIRKCYRLIPAMWQSWTWPAGKRLTDFVGQVTEAVSFGGQF